MSDCKHGMMKGTCALCRRTKPVAHGRIIRSKRESVCRLCQQPITVGTQIVRRMLPQTISDRKPVWVWAHHKCESYVLTREEHHKRYGGHGPVARTPVDRASRYEITRLAEELDESDSDSTD